MERRYMTTNETKKIFSERLNKLVELRHKSTRKEDIVKGCGINIATLNSYLRGEVLPNSDKLVNIADYFCVSIDYLLGRVNLDTEMYKLEMRNVIEGSYEKYLGTNRNNPTESVISYTSNDPRDASYICPVWPYNLLDAVQHTSRRDDVRLIDYPLTAEQREGLGFALDYGLTDRERLCVLEYFKDELTLDECGKMHGVTRERIRQVVAKAVRKLRHPSRFDVIRYGIGIIETNRKKLKVQQLQGKLDAEILELNKKIAEVSAKNAISKDDMMDVLDITEEQVEEARQNVYTTPLIELDLSVRSYNCLTRVGCRSMADVIPKIEDDSIIKVRNLGRKSVKEIATKLLDLGYRSEKCQQYASL